MKIKHLLLSGFFICSVNAAYSQQKIKDNIIQGSALPVGDALLELESKNKGLLHVRLNLTSSSSPSPLSSHIAGMMVYNIATVNDVKPGIYYNDGTKWLTINTTKGLDGKDGLGIKGSTYNPFTGELTLTYSDGSTYKTNDLRGAAGLVGATGVQGPQGVPGIPGLQGLPGIPGAIGPAGPQGIQGNPGINGTNGVGVSSTNYNSTTGVLTITYSDGTTTKTSDLRGAAGAPGIQGLPGIAGINGTNGTNGTSVTGSSYDAATGVVTFTYSNGTTTSTTDIRGVKGPAGPQGIPGNSGINGTNGVGVSSTNYNNTTGVLTITYSDGTTTKTSDLRGAAGVPGIQGIQGLPGVAGINGTNGTNGTSVTGSSYDATTGVVTFTYSDGTTTSTTDIRGVKGPAGPQGIPGNPGINGTNGVGVSSTNYNNTTGVLTITYSDGSTAMTTDLRGANGFGGKTIGSDFVTVNGAGTDANAYVVKIKPSTSPNMVLSTNATGDLEWITSQSQTIKSAMPKFFYMPAIIMPTAANQLSNPLVGESFVGTTGKLNLYERYKVQFSSPMVSNASKTTTLPVLLPGELDYYITWFDNTVFSAVSVSNTGILTYTVLPNADITVGSFMNIVFAVKP